MVSQNLEESCIDHTGSLQCVESNGCVALIDLGG